MPLGIARLNTLGRIISAAPSPSPSVIYRYGNFVEGYNGASISTAQNKVGTSSIYLDGNDFLMVRSPSNNIVLSGDFTVETWFRLPGGNPTIGAFFWFNPFLLYQSANAFYLWNGSGNVAGTGGVTINSNTWYHLALVRSNGNVSFYFNGTLIGGPTNYTATITANDDNKYIGNYQNGYFFNVYFDEYRISNTARYIANFTPSTSAFTNDESTLLLLHGEGTNGSTIIYDDADIRYPVSVQTVGNAQISTAQSKIGSSSAVFDGSGDYLQLTNLTPSNVFTYELWVRFNTLPGNNTWQMLVTSSSTYYFGVYNNNGTREYQIVINNVGRSFTAQALTTNTWIHIALIQDGTTCKLYENGVLQTASGGNLSTTVSLFNSSPILGIYTNNSLPFDGYMDEIRYSRIVRYTSNFTPSTTAFENDADTLMLLHCEGANANTQFTDDNGGYVFPKTVTRVGNAQVSTAQSKFGNGSAYFDGVNDYLNVAYDPTLRFGTGDFTVECWFRPTARTQSYPLLMGNNGGFSTGSWVLHERHNSANTAITFWSANYNNGSSPMLTSTTTISNNTWYHVAITRSGSTFRMFVNGVQEAIVTSSFNLDSGSALNASTIGGDFTVNNAEFTGYIDEVRWSNTARYTSNFTPSASAFTYDANTVLLIHADGYNGYTTFTDDIGQTIQLPSRPAATITAVGNAQISTAQKQVGTGSIYLDGSGDYLTVDANIPPFWTGNFTIEGWVRAQVYGGYLCDLRLNGGPDIALLWANNSLQPYVYPDNPTVSFSFVNNTWYHVAMVRNNGVVKIYIDGVERHSFNNSYNIGSVADLTIGARYNAQDQLNGYIDEFRISNIARYTSAFTPSTSAFTNDVNTVLLIHADGTNGSTTFTDDNA